MHTTSEDVEAPQSAGSESARRRSGIWPLLVRVHFYAGVFVAPFLVVAALTGLAYTLTPQLDQMVYREQLYAREPGRSPLPLAAQVASARQAHPEGSIAAVAPAGTPERTTRVVLSVPEELGEEHQRTVYVDPSSGQVQGALTTWFGYTPLRTWFDDLHRNLQLGEPGRMYSELAASWLWVLVLGGLVLWLLRPGSVYRTRGRWSRALLPERSARGVRATRSWHAAIGVWLFIGLLFLSVTGLTWSRYAGARFGALLDLMGSSTPEIDVALHGVAGQAGHGEHDGHGGAQPGDGTDLPAGVSIDQVLASAREAGIDGPVEITPPPDAGRGWVVAQIDEVWPVRQDQVLVDPRSAAIVTHLRWGEHPLLAKLSTLGVLAHMGILFGWPNQLLLAALAIGVLVAIFFGYRMWWQRRPTRAGQRALAGRPPARGAWREVSPAAMAVIAVATIAVACALPVLGASLAAFLLVDLAVGARQASRSRAAA